VRDRLLRGALEAITIYQQEIGPSLSACCRFTPGCSTYAATALEELGLRRGGWLATRRLLRCHPRAAGGHDPVPMSSPRAA
jgi:putative membrane protein insertion efficiency factor